MGNRKSNELQKASKSAMLLEEKRSEGIFASWSESLEILNVKLAEE